MGGFAFCFCCNGLGFVGCGGGGWFWGAERLRLWDWADRLGFWEILFFVFAIIVWFLSGMVGGGRFGVEGLGGGVMAEGGLWSRAYTWVVVEGLGLKQGLRACGGGVKKGLCRNYFGDEEDYFRGGLLKGGGLLHVVITAVCGRFRGNNFLCMEVLT